MNMENYPEYIDAYFNRALSPEEIKQFEQRIIEDKDFAEYVAFYLSSKQAFKEEMIKEKKEWFRQLAAQNNSLSESYQINSPRKLWLYRVAVAAAILTCIFFAGYLYFKPVSTQQIADNYIEGNLKPLPVTMGTEKDSIQDGLRLYNENKLDSSLKLFESIIQRDTGNYLAKEYAGIVYLRLGNYDKALAYFQQLEKITLVSNPATFYHALTLMKRNQPGDKQQARQLLKQVVKLHLEYEETAQQWLDKW
jgi:tetratricopeptide (TPR) repeat protein